MLFIIVLFWLLPCGE